ncbi:hypothetical protein B6U81_03135 [Thermoplasmatales archaeon ex4484_30]|nr:MAG: hypothetical protein B6U81_03135 [Thermoplasmatales archaeon ex4484_30]
MKQKKSILIFILLILLLFHSGCFKKEMLVANFSYVPENPTTNDIIHFIDKSICKNGSIVSWRWDFDLSDEYTSATSTLQNPSFRYAYGYGKTFVVTLTIEDSNGRTATCSKKIYIVHQSHLPGKNDILLEVLSHERKEKNIDGSAPPQENFVCVWVKIKMANNWDRDLLRPQSGWAGTTGWKGNFYLYTDGFHKWGHSGILPEGKPEKISPGENATWIVTFWIPSSAKEYMIEYTYLYDVSMETPPKELDFVAPL